MGISEILTLAKDGGIAGLFLAVVAVIVIVVLGFLFKNRAVVSIGEKEKLVDNTQIVAIQAKLSSIEEKVGGLEREVHDRATREEVHALDKSITRLEGRIDTMQATAQSTAHGVSRIEEFMYAAALRERG